LLDVIAGRRSRKNKLRDQAIEFLTETGNDINSVISIIQGQLEGHSSESYSKLVESFTRLYAKRMRVQIGSQAYLNSEDFHQQYDKLLHELERVASFLDREQDTSNQIISKIQERRNRLGKAWPIENEMQQAPANKPADELMIWMEMIRHRTTHFLSNNLRSAL
jgi:uncharacterized protein YukE